MTPADLEFLGDALLAAPADVPLLVSAEAALTPSRAESGANRRLIPVLHVINGEHYAGAERVQDLLAQRLVEFGYDVGFATLKRGRFSDARGAHRAKLFPLHMAGRFDLRPAIAMARLVRAGGYRVIHTHTPRAALVGRLASWWTGAPLVHHVHSPTLRDSTRSSRDRLNAAIERWAMRGAATVIAVSDSLADYVAEQGIDRDRIVVVPNGVPTLGPLPLRAPPTGRWTLGCVALFRPRKGVESLLAAISLLRRQGRDVTLRAIGSFETPDYESETRRLVERLGLGDAVEWVGFSSNVTEELRRLDLFVLPSLFGEGMPMVVLEAMAAGTPVVATQVEGVPQVIRDEQDGLLAHPGSPEDLKRQIERVIDGQVDWNGLRRSAHERQRNLFSDQAMARRVANVYARAARIAPVRQRPQRVRLFGMEIDAVDMRGAVEQVYGWIRSPEEGCRYVVTPNVDHVVLYQRRADFRAAYARASLVLADGMPVVAAARLLRRGIRQRVAGSDLVPALFQATKEFGPLRVYLLGAAPGVADQAARNIMRRWPRVAVVGAYSPPLGFEHDASESARILRQIEASRPDLLIIGFGAPKQELWVAEHRERIAAAAALCAGASIDFLAGEKRRAPRWMRKTGLEWAHRLASEPRRLAARYARDAWVFPGLLWRELRRGGASSAGA
jgi:exopolysaccharide biosynthesis WecB/TagA/CpsF family protein